MVRKIPTQSKIYRVEDSTADVVVCQLSHIPVKLKNQFSSDSRNLPAVFQIPNIVRSDNTNKTILWEIESYEVSTLLEELGSAEGIESQLYCYTDQDTHFLATLGGRQKRDKQHTWFLNVIIYGPAILEEIIGESLSSRKLYLQDPLGCNRNVQYRNPHLLSPETQKITMTSSIEFAIGNLEIEQLEIGPDLLARLMENQESLLETNAPTGVKTSLFRCDYLFAGNKEYSVYLSLQ